MEIRGRGARAPTRARVDGYIFLFINGYSFYLFTQGSAAPRPPSYDRNRAAGLYFIHSLLNSGSISRKCLYRGQAGPRVLFAVSPLTRIRLGSPFSLHPFRRPSGGYSNLTMLHPSPSVLLPVLLQERTLSSFLPLFRPFSPSVLLAKVKPEVEF